MNTLIKSVLLFSTVVVACQREVVVNENPIIKTFNSFSVTVEDTPMTKVHTKVHIEDGGAVKWDYWDCIAVYSDIQDPVQYFRDSDGVFRGDPITGNVFYAIYPCYSVSEVKKTDTPSEIQRYVGGGLLMAAKSEDDKLLFKQVGGIIHMRIDGMDPKEIDYVSLIGNDSEDLTGYCNIGWDGDTPYSKLIPDLNKAALSAIHQGNDYYFYVLTPIVFEKGFSVSIGFREGEHYYALEKKTEKRIQVDRAEMKNFVAVDAADLLEERNIGLDQDRQALIAIYNSLDGDHWINNSNWCSDKPFKEWYGVSTNAAGRVDRINLRNNRVRGVFPDEIGLLTELRGLDFCSGTSNTGGIYLDDERNNRVSGIIPPSIGNLKKLEQLLLWGNSLSGSIPDSFCDLTSLRELALDGAFDMTTEEWERIEGYGYLSGPIPERIGNLQELTYISLQGQMLSGNVPSSFSSLKKLAYINLASNYLTGPLPDVSGMLDLYKVGLSSNNFTSIPASYAGLMDLPNKENIKSQSGFVNNRLSGPLPREISSHPDFSEYAWMFLGYQQPGYKVEIDEDHIPACRHTFKTLGGGILNLGDLYSQAEYTMIVRWAEWCNPTRWFLPNALELEKKYRDKGLQMIGAYAGGYESARAAFMEEMGLNDYEHIIEREDGHIGFDIMIDYAVWWEFLGYRTPFVEIVNKAGNIVFIDDNNHLFSDYSFIKTRDELETFLVNLFGSIDEYESEDYTADGQVHTLQIATEGKGIDVVLMGDAFSDRLIVDGTYESAMKDAMNALFSEEPYKSNKDLFNVYYIDVVSKNEVYKGETALGTWYGEGTAVGGSDEKVFQYAGQVLSEEQLDDALLIVMMNRDYYAGTCYMYFPDSGDYSRGPAVAYFPTSSDTVTFNGLVSHEAGGHGFAKLADEYFYGGRISDEGIAGYHTMEPYGWWKNVDFTSDPTQVKWAQFLTDERYSNEGLGVFEGACTYAYGAWRPTEQSIMNENVGGFNAPSRYAIWYRINKLAYGEEWQGTYEDFVEYDKVNRTPAAIAKRQQQRRNYVEKDFEPLAPPVIINKDWRELVKK